MVKGITLAGNKGGSGKSTTSAGLAAILGAGLFGSGAPVRPVWVYADYSDQSEDSEALINDVFGPPDARVVRWLSDRGFYVCLRESLPGLAQSLTEAGKLDEHVFIFDTGATLAEDAAKNFVPHSQAVLLPYNRSGASDGVSRLLATIDTIDPDGAISHMVKTVLTMVPSRLEDRRALLRKADLQDLFSSAARSTLMDAFVPQSSPIADMASIRQPVGRDALRRARTAMLPVAREILEVTGWDIDLPSGADDPRLRALPSDPTLEKGTTNEEGKAHAHG